MTKRFFTLALIPGLAVALLAVGCKSNTTQENSATTSSVSTGPGELIDYQIALGNDKLADKFGGLIGLPTSFLYSRDGKKIKTVIGLINPSDLSKAIEAELAKGETTPAPAPETAAVFPSLEGADLSVSQFKGKVVLVNFWATWCEPCRTEIPWLIESNRKYGPKGLVILGVAMDDDGKKIVDPWVKSTHFNVTGS